MAIKPFRFAVTFFISLILLIPFTASADKYSVRKGLIRTTNIAANEKYTFKYCNPLRQKPFNKKDKRRKLLLVGDSQVCDFLNSMKANGYLRNYQISVRYIPYQCQPIIYSQHKHFIARKDRALCKNKERTDNLEEARDQIAQADVVIFSARWKLKAAQALPATLRHLRFKPHQKVIVLGGKFFGKIAIRKYLRMPDRKLMSIRNRVNGEVKRVNTLFRTKLGRRFHFIDQYKLVCESNNNCPVFTGNLELMSYDGWHLTKAGARFVGNIIYNHSILKHL